MKFISFFPSSFAFFFFQVGVGFLPLMLNGESILEDMEHSVLIYSLDDGPNSVASDKNSSSMAGLSSLSEGLVKVRTRAVVSLVSSDKRVQAALRAMPAPLGMCFYL